MRTSFPADLIRYDLNLMMLGTITPAGTPIDDSPGHIEARLRLMDEAGTDIQVLSPPPIPAVMDRTDVVQTARIVNDSFATLVKAYPGRFRAFAWLPLSDPEAAV